MDISTKIFRAQSVREETSYALVLRCVLTWLVAGVDFKVKVMEVASPDGKMKRVKVTIWDTGNGFRASIVPTSMWLLICSLACCDFSRQLDKSVSVR